MAYSLSIGQNIVIQRALLFLIIYVRLANQIWMSRCLAEIQSHSFDFCTNNTDSWAAPFEHSGHPLAMLTRIYIEALLVDEDLADQVWELWNAGAIADEVAAWAWWITANVCSDRKQSFISVA